MEQTVSVLFTKDLTEKALQLYKLDEHYKVLGDFENYVLEVYRNGQPYIFRMTHSSHRSREDVQSEVDWMMFLHREGVNVPNVFPSVNNEYVESISAGDTFFHLTLFEKAKGSHVRITNEADHRELFIQLGKTIGKMHRVTRKYIPSHGVQPRPQWEDDELMDIEKYIPHDQKDVILAGKEILEKVYQLPKDKNVYGLCHTDVHNGNYFVDHEGNICVFDFDDAMYGWLAHDLSIPIYYACLYGMKGKSKEERTSFGKKLYQYLMEGYRTENVLGESALKTIPLFFQLRDLTLYTVLYKKLPIEELEGPGAWLMEELKQRLISREWIIDLY